MLVAEDEWKQKLAQRRGLRILQSHGRQDVVIPFFLSSLLEGLLRQSCNVEFLPFEGGHEAPPAFVFEKVGQLLVANETAQIGATSPK